MAQNGLQYCGYLLRDYVMEQYMDDPDYKPKYDKDDPNYALCVSDPDHMKATTIANMRRILVRKAGLELKDAEWDRANGPCPNRLGFIKLAEDIFPILILADNKSKERRKLPSPERLEKVRELCKAVGPPEWYIAFV